MENKLDLPGVDWYKDCVAFKLCSRGSLAKIFHLRGHAVKGEARLRPSSQSPPSPPFSFSLQHFNPSQDPFSPNFRPALPTKI